jgi:hypothetical protein
MQGSNSKADEMENEILLNLKVVLGCGRSVRKEHESSQSHENG